MAVDRSSARAALTKLPPSTTLRNTFSDTSVSMAWFPWKKQLININPIDQPGRNL